jgi:hypothetical protein
LAVVVEVVVVEVAVVELAVVEAVAAGWLAGMGAAFPLSLDTIFGLITLPGCLGFSPSEVDALLLSNPLPLTSSFFPTDCPCPFFSFSSDPSPPDTSLLRRNPPCTLLAIPIVPYRD